MPTRSAQPLTGQAEGEEVVYTTVERRCGMASQPTTARGIAIVALISLSQFLKKVSQKMWDAFSHGCNIAWEKSKDNILFLIKGKTNLFRLHLYSLSSIFIITRNINR